MKPPAIMSTRGSRRRTPADAWAAAVVGVLATVMIALVVIPIVVSIANAFSGGAGASASGMVHEAWFGRMVGDTVLVVGLGAVLAVGIAALLAWLIERTDAGLGRLGDSLPLVPLFLPVVAMPIGWVMLAAPKGGFINEILAQVTPGFQIDIYSMPGLIFIYVLELVPFAYLPLAAAFRSLDSSLEEAARTSGASPLTTFATVSLPAIGPSVISAVLMVVVVGLAQFSAPVIIGTPAKIDILSVQIVDFVRGTYPPAYDKALLLGLGALIVATPLLLLQRKLGGGNRFASVGGRGARAAKVRLGPLRLLARSILIGYLALTTVLPVAALAIVSFQAYWQPDLARANWTFKAYQQMLFQNQQASAAILNSLMFGLVVGALAIVIAGTLALYAYRTGNRLGAIADASVKIPAMIPSVVLAIGFILSFAGPPMNLGGTRTILLLGYLVTYIPYASIIVAASAQQVHRSMDEASSLSGAGSLRTLWEIVVPLIVPGLFAAYALVFVRVIGDLSMSVLLGTGQTPVMGYVLLDLWQQGTSFSSVAVLSLVQMLVSIPVVLLLVRFGRPRWQRPQSRRPGARRETAAEATLEPANS